MTIKETLKLNRTFEFVIIAIMLILATYFLIPLYLMIVNSLKPLSEIRGGNMLALPIEASLDH